MENSEKIIPIMGCPDIRAQVEFYKALGFAVLNIYTSPNPYATLKWKTIDIHFYGSRKVDPSKNPTMCYIMVTDVDEVNQTFTNGLKRYYGKIPRAGFPKITKVRNLVDDRRFTLTDPGGNTLFIGSKATEEDRFFRKLDNQENAKIFTVLYDVLYSKEDPKLAESMLPKYAAIGSSLLGLDKAKYLLLLADIKKQLGRQIDDSELKQLIHAHENNEGWENIRRKHMEILKQEEA